VFPPVGVGSVSAEFHEDDGESEAWRDGVLATWRLAIDGDAVALAARVTVEGVVEGGRRMVLVLPPGEARAVRVVGAALVGETVVEGCRRIEVEGG
jgi:alpha-glucosidase